ncbi:NAD(P)/FAD-dependent oxidoreductase [Tenacibaculum soleae]|uniref:NAD(P)/FAD-dependent oxidoreductase n=1 Tax=Tenacibaculum soleae TaxID=447689 RepID=UPI00230030E1|nr:FAD-dependent oxidoreductase [Tenacibaculum soleae]
MRKTDILIIGGGIAGCIAAISLAKDYNVTLIDKQITPSDRIGESLAPAAQRILKKLDLLENESDKFKQTLFSNNLGMQSYWGSNQLHIVDHLKNPDGFSKSLDRAKFETYLRKKALDRGVLCLWGIRLFNSVYEENIWRVTGKSDNLKNRTTHAIEASFVIDATGRQSHFAKSIGIKRIQCDKLISCWISMPNTNINTMSTIIAEQQGWWYSSVLPNNTRIISFQTDSDIIDKAILKNSESFLALLKKNQVIHSLIPKNKKDITFHGTVSANSTRLEQVAGKQWIALGDAAISFDPLSSQGMFNAMANAMQVKELLTNFNIINDFSLAKMENFNNTYSNQIEHVWSHYLKHKNLFYKAEARWKESTFWKRRS